MTIYSVLLVGGPVRDWHIIAKSRDSDYWFMYQENVKDKDRADQMVRALNAIDL